MATKTSKTAAPKKVSSKTANENAMSLADIWDNTDPSEANNNLPPGEHEVRVNGIELRSDKKKGDVAIITYEAIEGDHEGKKLRQLYKLRDADGGKGPGVAFLQRDLELLGYKEIDGKKMPKVLKEITEEQPMVIINAKQSGQYVNAYLQGLPEDAGKSSDGGDDDDEIEVGDTVSGKNDDGEKIEGEVVKINSKKGTATVKDDEGDEHTCDLDDLSKADGDGDGDDEPTAPEVGDEVKFTDPEDEDETLEGEVLKVNEKKETFDAKVGKKTIKGIEFSAIKKDDDDDADGGDAGDADEEIEVGDKVTGENEDGDDIEGEVVKIKKDVATVKDDEGDEHKCALSDLKKAEDDDADAEGADTDEPPSVGDDVKFTDPEDEDEELEGEVVKVNEKKETFDAKVGKKVIKGIGFDAIKKEDDDAGDDDEIEVGDEVKFEDEDGDDVTGKVKSIDGKFAKVKDDDGKVHKVKVADLTKE